MPILAIAWSEGVEDAWSDVATFVPRFIAFLVILLVGYLIVKLIAKAADAVLERVGFDRWVERGGVGRVLSRSQYDASDLLSKVIFYALFLIVLQLAFGVFGPNPISDLLEGVIAYLPKVIVAIIIVVIAAAIAAAARELIEAALGGLSYGTLLANVTAIGIITVGVFMALDQLQIAPAIVTGLFYALLAIIVGCTVIAVGGGGIQPMRQRWERAFSRYDMEKPRLQDAMKGSKERMKARTRERAAEAKAIAGAEPAPATASPAPAGRPTTTTSTPPPPPPPTSGP
jgi:Conserved TM helix